ncbi:MAG: hypothetical protein ACE5F1_09840, partial [Planctomycetota bacterium]
MMRREAGFTLVEVMLVTTMMVPLLASIIGTITLLKSSLKSGDRRASLSETTRITNQRLAHIARSGVLSTCRTKATSADVAAARLAQQTGSLVPIPVIGEWISPPPNAVRDNIRFRSANGILSMNASALTAPRELAFAMDPGEKDNGVDDDKDGLIDEGRLVLRVNSGTVTVAGGVEEVSFSLSGRILRVTLRCACADGKGKVYRKLAARSYYM